MSVTYTNRKGRLFFLCKGTTQNGKMRYTFTREPVGDTVEQLPEGYRIQESVNGVVSLVKERPQLIHPEEVDRVEAVLKQHPKATNYRIDVKDNQIILYERLGPNVEEISPIFGEISPLPANVIKKRIQEQLEKTAKYAPILRFLLEDREKRTFRAERYYSLGSREGWTLIADSGTVKQMARQFIPKLGTDDFYELF